MCGRFALPVTLKEIEEVFSIDEWISSALPSHNISPSRLITALRRNDGKTIGCEMLWNFLPAWAAAKSIKPMINARAETIGSKPFFRTAFIKQRCLIPATGYYEWQKTPGGTQPWFIRFPDFPIVALAGIWERGDGGTLNCAIITRGADQSIASIHDRMPLIIKPDLFTAWLGDGTPSLEDIIAAEHRIIACPVSSHVNNPRHDGPQCLQ